MRRGILRLYENDIVQHVIKQQLRSDHMTGLVRRQGAYAQNKQTASEMKATANKLAKSSFLGRDPSGERPTMITDSLWERHELSEQGALLKDVKETVWNYLRVHLTRILHKDVHARVQAQEDMIETWIRSG